MSWSRRALTFGLAAGLAACGFAPVYGPERGGLSLRGAVRTTEPDTAFGFAFTRQVEERLGLPTATRFDLDWSVAIDDTALAIDGANNITRFNLEGRLDWTLAPAGGGAPVLTGQEVAFTAYSATGSTISTLESERDARRRLAVILADKVVARLLAEAGT